MQGHYIFITVVTYNRQPILIDNIEILKAAFHKTILKYDYELFAVVILPDHFHIIIRPKQAEDFSKIVGSIKKYFTYNLNLKNSDGASKRRALQNESRNKRKESNIWQRRFYDHIIRDDEDLFKHVDYIHYNPVKHKNISPKDWEYSSFKKFVKDKWYEENWYNFGDKHNIENIDLE